ncbi:hypothetical protein [Helicobacter sp. T3_23-1059]
MPHTNNIKNTSTTQNITPPNITPNTPPNTPIKATQNTTKNITIGFFHHYGLGDNIMAIKALYLAKKAYNCRLIIFGNALLKEILDFVDFIDSADEILDIGSLSKKSLNIITKYRCDYFLLSNPKSQYIRLLSPLDTPIITALKFASFFSTKTKYPPLLFFAKYRKLSAKDALCVLVRLVDTNAFDEFVREILLKQKTKTGGGQQKSALENYQHQKITYDNFERVIKELDSALYNEIKLKISPDIEQHAKDFLHKQIKNAQTPQPKPNSKQKSKNTLDSTQNPTNSDNVDSAKNPFMIFVNPFSNAATHTLPLSAFLDMVGQILTNPKNQNLFILILTFPSVHNDFIAQVENHPVLSSLPNPKKQKLIIYPNDNTLSFLIAFANLSSLMISPSTGSIHLAYIQGIKTIGLYSRKDTHRWATKDKIYTIIPHKKSSLNHKQITKIINTTIQTMQNLIDSSVIKPFAFEG